MIHMKKVDKKNLISRRLCFDKKKRVQQSQKKTENKSERSAKFKSVYKEEIFFSNQHAMTRDHHYQNDATLVMGGACVVN